MIFEDRNSGKLKNLLITQTNLLNDSIDSVADRELLRVLGEHGLASAAVGLYPFPSELEPDSWLTRQGWNRCSSTSLIATEASDLILVENGTVPLALVRGDSSRLLASNEQERKRLLQVVESVLDHWLPSVVMIRSGSLSADFLALARGRGISTVALQRDSQIRTQATLRDADVVLTPTTAISQYLRDAHGHPCAVLPPVVPEMTPERLSEAETVVFDATSPGCGLMVFAQIAEELGRRRPGLPVTLVGASVSLEMPRGGTLRCVPKSEAASVWRSARVCIAPATGWEHYPHAAMTALHHGVPVLTSGRGADSELLGAAALVLPLPARITSASHSQLRPEELAPWVEMILRICEDRTFAERQRGLAILAAQRLSSTELAPRYAKFLAHLAAGKCKARSGSPAFSLNGKPRENESALRTLVSAHPWPEQAPEDAAPGQEPGWLAGGTEVMLARSLSSKTKLVVELGAWLGMSTRYMADTAPRATVISIDHWRGSPEHHSQERFQALLPRLFETFQARCWNYRERVIPLRMTSLEGLRRISESGLEPDFIYFDAEHSFEAVTAELKLARVLFPDAPLGGDDYDWPEVRRAVNEFAMAHGLVVDRHGSRGWRLLEGWQAGDAAQPPPARAQSVVLVPHLNGIEWECEQALRQLESAGVRVVRRGGCSAIDVARNELISEALHDGAEQMLFVDSDIGFDPTDALRLLARPEPVVAGIYAKKSMRELASVFADGVKEVLFGPEAPGPYPLKYAATGFLRIQAGVLRQMVADLQLPLCNTHWGRGIWPFFHPQIVPHGPGKWHYLGEDWSFSDRLGRIGIVPVADTSIRLWHWGRYGFGWEDAGSTVSRYQSYSYNLAPSAETARVEPTATPPLTERTASAEASESKRVPLLRLKGPERTPKVTGNESGRVAAVGDTHVQNGTH